MDDVRKLIYGTVFGFLAVIGVWLSIVYLSSCGFSIACPRGASTVIRTPIPTLVPATLPAVALYVPTYTPTPAPTELAAGVTPAATEAPSALRPSNPGEPGQAVNLTGDAEAGKTLFATNCAACHNTEGKGGNPNPGAEGGTIPALNPVNPLLKSSDYKTFATNLDLFIEHGSTPKGTNPAISMPQWGDLGLLQPQQIADVIAYIISLNP